MRMGKINKHFLIRISVAKKRVSAGKIVLSIWIGGLLFLSCVFFALGWISHTASADWNRTITFYFSDTLICSSEITKLSDGENAAGDNETVNHFTAWKTASGQRLSGKDTGRSTVSDVLLLCGNSHSLIPFGKSLDESDTEGCLIGQKTAEELFGAHDVEGQQIQYDDRSLTVRGVLREPEDIVICQEGGVEQDAEFDHISIWRDVSQSIKMTEERFLGTYGLDGQVLRFDMYRDLKWITELIPGKWSDFSGWKNNIEEKKQEFAALKSAPKDGIALVYMRYVRLRNINWCLGAIGICVCLFMGHKLYKIQP